MNSDPIIFGWLGWLMILFCSVVLLLLGVLPPVLPLSLALAGFLLPVSAVLPSFTAVKTETQKLE